MRSVARDSVSPAMVVAFAALVIAVTGSAVAASGGFAGSDGTVQACVAAEDIVHRLTDGVDQVTAGVTAPVTQGVNSAVDGVNQVTGGAVSHITDSFTPKGSVLIVAPGSHCPSDYAPQTLAATSATRAHIVAARSERPVTLGRNKADIATTAVSTPGAYLVSANANITVKGASAVARTVKCALVGTDGQTIPGTTSSGTIPAGVAGGMHLSIAINSYLRNVPQGPLALVCKASLPAVATPAPTAAQATPLHGLRQDDTECGGPGNPCMDGTGDVEATDGGGTQPAANNPPPQQGEYPCTSAYTDC